MKKFCLFVAIASFVVSAPQVYAKPANAKHKEGAHATTEAKPKANKEAKPHAALDGKTYAGIVQNEGSAQPDKDNFIFKNGTFRSTACDKYGFGPGAYSMLNKDGTTSFHATTKNKAGATIAWNGIVEGTKISGTGTLTEKNGDHSKMTFEGEIAKTH